MKEEITRRASKTDLVLALFHAYPQQWLGWRTLAQVGGGCAWRSRIADARRRVKRQGGDIEWNKNIKASAYCYRPQARMGRTAELYRAQTLFDDRTGPFD